jgi:hypothetical protein
MVNEQNEPMPAPARRYRRRIYVSGFGIQRLLMVSICGVALFGGVLGDIYLWRLLYG